MKAISLLQPWASLLAFGSKRIETRSWPAPAHVLGQALAIHASASFVGGFRALAIGDDRYRHCLSTGSRRHYGHDFWNPEDPALKRALARKADYPPLEAFDLPTGAILAVGRLVSSSPTLMWIGSGLTPLEREFGDFSSGRYGWEFADVVVLPEPVPCRGALGIWGVRPDVEQLVHAELAKVTRRREEAAC